MNEKIRLLVCKTCQTVQELPWYEGDPRDDTWLNEAVNSHPKFGDGRPHIAGGLFNIDVKKLWSTPQQRQTTIEELYKQLEIPGQGQGMGESYYDLKSTFLDDAMACWKSFRRPTDPGNCDYRKDNKRLYPDTKAERKDLGLSPNRPNTYLCDFCPLQSIVQQRIREEAGLYDA